MKNILVNVASDFSKTPGPRNKKEGDFSGEEFREKLLSEKFELAKKNGVKLIVNLDRTFGYGTSFLEEAFGGLARAHGAKDVLKHIDFISNEEPYLIEDIIGYINDTKGGS